MAAGPRRGKRRANQLAMDRALVTPRSSPGCRRPLVDGARRRPALRSAGSRRRSPSGGRPVARSSTTARGVVLAVCRDRLRQTPCDGCGAASTRLGAPAGDLRVQRGRRIRFRALPWDLRVLIFVLGVAGRAAGLLHLGADHRDNGMVRQPPLARAVVVQNVTKPKLALFHPKSPRIRWRGKEARKARAILAELVSGWQERPATHPTTRASHCRTSARRRRRPPAGAVDCGVRLAATDCAGRHPLDDVRAETVARRPPLVERERPELATLGDELADQRPDDLVRPPKRHAAADQVVRHVGGQEQARSRGFAARSRLSVKPATTDRTTARHPASVSSASNTRLLVFLQVLVVSARQSLHRGQQAPTR